MSDLSNTTNREKRYIECLLEMGRKFDSEGLTPKWGFVSFLVDFSDRERKERRMNGVFYC